jgi:predicted nucleic acid-binding protein
MSIDCFLDTNVLVYAAAGRDQEEAKRKRALELIEQENDGG